ncbi:MAG: DUF2304 family protein [Candidatus Woesearchaeota archaeon]
MIAGIQIVGIFFALFMLYLTFLYFKRDDYGVFGFLVWFAIWSAFLVLVSFPRTVYGIMYALKIERTADFFVATALMFFSIVIFKLYDNNKKLNKKMEDVIRKVAFMQAGCERSNCITPKKNKVQEKKP